MDKSDREISATELISMEECLNTEISKLQDTANSVRPGQIRVLSEAQFMGCMMTLEQAGDTLENQTKIIEKLTLEMEGLKAIKDKVVAYARKQGTLTSGILMLGDEEIVIPGFNGPKPEHAHLSRDTMQDVLTHGKAHKEAMGRG
jgi:hypothetical protein